jgi:hypothetical protein
VNDVLVVSFWLMIAAQLIALVAAETTDQHLGKHDE